MENEKTELINILFHFPGRAVYTRQGFIFALIFLLHNVAFSFIEFQPIGISRRQ